MSIEEKSFNNIHFKNWTNIVPIIVIILCRGSFTKIIQKASMIIRTRANIKVSGWFIKVALGKFIGFKKEILKLIVVSFQLINQKKSPFD